jgi:regulatory protein SWI5
MSPADHKSTHSSYTGEVKPLMGSSTPSQSSIQSNPFSTPPTSPADQKDELEDLFNTMTENGSSQFELEMKAIGDFTSLDTTTCDFLDFNM